MGNVSVIYWSCHRNIDIRSDCTPFTQAGYVGEDADVCIHRLLAASNWDVRRAGELYAKKPLGLTAKIFVTESGIVCLDEFDKIAKPKSNHGSKDISGEVNICPYVSGKI